MKTFVMFPSSILILFVFAVTANAGEARAIELIDGSIITGEVLAGGIYDRIRQPRHDQAL